MSVDIGEGYRELRIGEVKKLGDEWCVRDVSWQPVPPSCLGFEYDTMTDWICRRKRTASDDVLDRMKIAIERQDWAAASLGELPEQLRTDLRLIVTEWMEDRS